MNQATSGDHSNQRIEEMACCGTFCSTPGGDSLKSEQTQSIPRNLSSNEYSRGTDSANVLPIPIKSLSIVSPVVHKNPKNADKAEDELRLPRRERQTHSPNTKARDIAAVDPAATPGIPSGIDLPDSDEGKHRGERKTRPNQETEETAGARPALPGTPGETPDRLHCMDTAGLEAQTSTARTEGKTGRSLIDNENGLARNESNGEASHTIGGASNDPSPAPTTPNAKTRGRSRKRRPKPSSTTRASATPRMASPAAPGKPLMDLRHILKKHERTKPAPPPDSPFPEISFYGSLGAIPFLKERWSNRSVSADNDATRSPRAKSTQQKDSKTRPPSSIAPEEPEERLLSEKQQQQQQQQEEEEETGLEQPRLPTREEIIATVEYDPAQLERSREIFRADLAFADRPDQMLPLLPAPRSPQKSFSLRRSGVSSYGRPDEWLSPDPRRSFRKGYRVVVVTPERIAGLRLDGGFDDDEPPTGTAGGSGEDPGSETTPEEPGPEPPTEATPEAETHPEGPVPEPLTPTSEAPPDALPRKDDMPPCSGAGSDGVDRISPEQPAERGGSDARPVPPAGSVQETIRVFAAHRGLPAGFAGIPTIPLDRSPAASTHEIQDRKPSESPPPGATEGGSRTVGHSGGGSLVTARPRE